MKSLHRILFALFLAVSAISGCTDPIEEIPVKISLNKTLMSSLPVGSQQQLEAVVKPEGTDITVVWESDNEAVASVDADGIVTGVSVGTAVITASAGDASAECKVTVVALKPTAISLSPAKLQMKPGDTRELAVAFTPAEAVAEDLVWETSDASVAAVKDGVVTAAGEGEATVTVKCNGGNLAAVCRVNVTEDYVPVYVTAMQLTPAEMSLQTGEKKTIEVTYLPADAEEVTDLVWETSDADVARVENGTVEAVKAGNAVITAKCMGGNVTATCQVTVSEKQEPEPGPGEGDLQAVAINAVGGRADVQVGMELQLELACTPSTAVPSSVTWSVDTDTFASIDGNGLLKGKYAEKDASTGSWKTVVVTVKADGKEANLVVRVIPRQADEIRVDVPENNRLKVGSGWTFNPVIYPEGLGFSVMAICNPYSVLEGVCYTQPANPGRYSYTFSIASHQNLVTEYNVQTNVDIDVEPYWVESVSLPATQELELGSTIAMIPTFTSDVEGVEPTYRTVRWTSSAPSVVSVDENTGEMTAKAEGSAEIMVTTTDDWAVPAGTSHKSATCSVTVKQSDSSLNVGDYYYSDGTWSSTLESGKTVIGVVYAKVNATSSDPLLAKDHPDCTHGLVVGLSEYIDQDFGPVSIYNGHGYYKGMGYDPNMIVDTEKPNGYGNTLAHSDLNSDKSDYCLFFNKTDGVVAQHTGTVAAPVSASSWYIPSYKEMIYLVENSDAVNAALIAAGGTAIAAPYASEVSWDDNRSSDWYWTSTIFGSWYANTATYDHFKYPFDISKGGWTTAVQAYAKCKVRVVLAF